MAKRKYEFRPDKLRTNLLHKLYITKKQQQSILRWFLYAVVLLVLSVVQDVILCRMNVLGATTDLVPYGIFLICVTIGSEAGCIFSLIAAALYQFSGTGPGYHAIALIPILAVSVTILRQIYLRKNAGANILCATAALLVYELILFGIGVVLSQILLTRLTVFLMTTGLSFLAVPVLYPIIRIISRIGGETWKE